MTATKGIETNKVSPDFIKQLAGYGLARAEILYHLPDHPRLLQAYIWQDYDIAPYGMYYQDGQFVPCG